MGASPFFANMLYGYLLVKLYPVPVSNQFGLSDIKGSPEQH
jgi:hypothetical protein